MPNNLNNFCNLEYLGLKICFAEPSDKMSDDFKSGSDKSFLWRRTFAPNVKSFTTDFRSTLTYIRTLIRNLIWFVTLLVTTQHVPVVFQCGVFCTYIYVTVHWGEPYSTFTYASVGASKTHLTTKNQSRRTWKLYTSVTRLYIHSRDGQIITSNDNPTINL